VVASGESPDRAGWDFFISYTGADRAWAEWVAWQLIDAGYKLAADLANLGERQAARDLDQDTLDRRRRVLGQDHPDTLASATNLAHDLRELGEADDAP
jgi:hypothetical protein